MGLFGRKKKAVEALKKILSPAYRVKVGIEASKTWKALEYFYQSEAIQDLPYAPLFGPNLEELVRLKDENPEAWEEVWKPFVKEGGKIYELLGVGYIDGKLVKQEVEKGLEIMLDYWNDIKDEWWTHFKKPGDFWRNRIEWIMEGYKKWIKKNGEKYVNKVNNVQWLPVGEEVYAEIEGLPVIYCPMEERVRESTCMALAHAIASVDENARRGLERALESWRPTFKRPLEGDVALHYVYLHSEPFVSLAFYKVPKDYEKPLRLNEVIDGVRWDIKEPFSAASDDELTGTAMVYYMDKDRFHNFNAKSQRNLKQTWVYWDGILERLEELGFAKVAKVKAR